MVNVFVKVLENDFVAVTVYVNCGIISASRDVF